MPGSKGWGMECSVCKISNRNNLDPRVLIDSLASMWESQTCLIGVQSWGVSWGSLWPAFQATLTGGDFLWEVMRAKECKRRMIWSHVPRGGSPRLRVEEDT